jgi:hypothetical protein
MKRVKTGELLTRKFVNPDKIAISTKVCFSWRGRTFIKENNSTVARKNAFIFESLLSYGGFKAVLINNKNIPA